MFRRSVSALAGLALIGLGVAGCSSEPVEPTQQVEQEAPEQSPEPVEQEVSPDVQFKQLLESVGVDSPAVRDAAVDVGQQACNLFDKEPFEDAIFDLLDLADQNGVDAELLGSIVGAAVPVYCPEYTDDMDQFQQDWS